MCTYTQTNDEDTLNDERTVKTQSSLHTVRKGTGVHGPHLFPFTGVVSSKHTQAQTASEHMEKKPWNNHHRGTPAGLWKSHGLTWTLRPEAHSAAAAAAAAAGGITTTIGK